jgi:tetratricopeptide (TPR) repeat protein
MLFAEQPGGAGATPRVPADGNPAELAAVLGDLTVALLGSGDAESASITAACLKISAWAGRQGYFQTASHFAEAAAAVRPRDPGAAFAAGRAARWQAAYERAEQWFDRSLALARRNGDFAAYIDARLGKGTLHAQLGRRAAARDEFVLAWRTAKKHKIRELGAAAQHNLLAQAYEERRYDEAASHATLALRLYGARHTRFPYIAHDMAQLWTALGFFAPALPVFRAVRSFIDAPAERVQLMANIGRAAAGAGDTDGFHAAWDEVTRHARAGTQYVAAAYVNLAEGALLLRNPQQAAELAERGLEAARRRGERAEEENALALLNRIRGGHPGEHPPVVPPNITELSRDLVEALGRQVTGARSG